MKKSLKICAAIMFASTLFLNASFDSTGSFSLVSTAVAQSTPPQTPGYVTLSGLCPDKKTSIIVCGAGSNTSCTPSGTCPPLD